MVRKSLPYMGLARLKTKEQIIKRINEELEKFEQLKIEAEKQGMEVKPHLTGYSFVPKKEDKTMVRKSLDYYHIPRREPSSFNGGEKVEYDRDIDVSAIIEETIDGVKRRRFAIIDRAVKKARKEMSNNKEIDKENKEAEELSKQISEKLREGLQGFIGAPANVEEVRKTVLTEIKTITGQMQEDLNNAGFFMATSVPHDYLDELAKQAPSQRETLDELMEANEVINEEIEETGETGFPFYHYSIMIVSGANMASEEEIRTEIKGLDSIIGTGYYDDEAGNELLKHIREYLSGKLTQGDR